jgi:hypothetical protein
MITVDPSLKCALAATLSLRGDVAEAVNRELLNPRLNVFFSSRGVTDFRPLDSDHLFHELEFAGSGCLPIEFFYRVLFEGCHRTNSGQLSHPTSFQWSADQECCVEHCQQSSLYYETLFLGSVPVHYILLLPVADVMRYVREYYQRLQVRGDPLRYTQFLQESLGG